jgi:hypothetical protein
VLSFSPSDYSLPLLYDVPPPLSALFEAIGENSADSNNSVTTTTSVGGVVTGGGMKESSRSVPLSEPPLVKGGDSSTTTSSGTSVEAVSWSPLEMKLPKELKYDGLSTLLVAMEMGCGNVKFLSLNRIAFGNTQVYMYIYIYIYALILETTYTHDIIEQYFWISSSCFHLSRSPSFSCLKHCFVDFDIQMWTHIYLLMC